MRKITSAWLMAIGLVFLSAGSVNALTPVLSCGWCGSSCTNTAMMGACTDSMPPAGKTCVAENGACVIKPTDGGLPDLIIGTSVTQEGATAGEYKIKMVFGNKGTAATNGTDFKLSLYIDPTSDPSSSSTVSFQTVMLGNVVLKPGATESFTTQVPLSVGNHKIYAKIDGDNMIREANEDNNISYTSYNVASSCGWCGDQCTRVSSACVLIAPPAGKVCVNNNWSCVIRSAPTPTLAPTCMPMPPCVNGIKDANGNVIYCDPKPGVFYCPVTTPTRAPTPTRIMSCQELQKASMTGQNYFSQCLTSGWPKVCFNKYTGQYMGCSRDNGEGCTVNNMYASSNMTCDSNLGSVSPTPTCVPRPPCVDGIKDANGLTVYCSLKPGVTYCPRVCKTGVNSFSLSETCENGNSRKMAATCYDGSTTVEGGPTSCKSAQTWLSYAETFCKGKSNCPVTTPSPTCIPRPKCLDTAPRCMMAEPAGGWCPVTTPTSKKDGDANNDGKVDLVDFSIWKSEYLEFRRVPPSSFVEYFGPKTSDFNRDGVPDMVDFSIWKQTYIAH